MKKIVATIIVLVITISVVAKEKNQSWDYSLDLDAKNRYHAPNNILSYPEPSFQTSWTAKNPEGGFNIWTNGELGRQLLDTNNGFASEVDFTAFLTKTFGESEVTAGISYWDYKNIGNFNDGDTIFTYLEVSGPLESITAFIRVESFTITSSLAWDGMAFYVGLRHSFQINEKLSISPQLYGVYDDVVPTDVPLVSMGAHQ